MRFARIDKEIKKIYQEISRLSLYRELNYLIIQGAWFSKFNF